MKKLVKRNSLKSNVTTTFLTCSCKCKCQSARQAGINTTAGSSNVSGRYDKKY